MSELAGVGRYQRHGSGPAVLVLSNPQVDPAWWAADLITALSAAGYEVITFRHTGAGTSPPQVADDVAALIEHLGTGAVRLLGWSQGAAIAQEVAVRHPHLAAAAVLIAPYARQNVADAVLQDAWAALRQAGEEMDPVRLAMLLLTSYPPQHLGRDDVTAPLVQGLRRYATKAASDADAQRRAAQFIAGYHDRLPGLRALRLPCLVIGFRDDADTFVARAREVAEAIADSRYLELPDAGHLTPVSDPDRVIGPVVNFLGQVGASAL
ncbi:alpha/beta fold hydrolase [Kineococcus arenarius]|uniref:alpha/beta fold hydrolase n=1 Tax=unclassified Kineococcus TaxID=2621656 RepID=UPI003D7C620A